MLYVVGNAAEAFGLRSMRGSDLVGKPMKSAIAAHLPDEHFVIRVDGRVKSHHRRFLDALREGLQTSGSVSAARRKSSVDAGGRSAKNCFPLNSVRAARQLSGSALIASNVPARQRRLLKVRFHVFVFGNDFVEQSTLQVVGKSGPHPNHRIAQST